MQPCRIFVLPLVNVTTLARTDKDLRRLVTLMTFLHGKRYR